MSLVRRSWLIRLARRGVAVAFLLAVMSVLGIRDVPVAHALYPSTAQSSLRTADGSIPASVVVGGTHYYHFHMGDAFQVCIDGPAYDGGPVSNYQYVYMSSRRESQSADWIISNYKAAADSEICSSDWDTKLRFGQTRGWRQFALWGLSSATWKVLESTWVWVD
jgi:hypothetical protein